MLGTFTQATARMRLTARGVIIVVQLAKFLGCSLMDSETPNAAQEDRALYLSAFRAAARYRNQETGRRHFAHDPTFRAAFVRRIVELRAALRA